MLSRYIAYNIPRDAVWITASIFFMLTYISYTTGSLFLGFTAQTSKLGLKEVLRSSP